MILVNINIFKVLNELINKIKKKNQYLSQFIKVYRHFILSEILYLELLFKNELVLQEIARIVFNREDEV